MTNLQELINSSRRGVAISPGVYAISTPLRLPHPSSGIYRFTPLPGAIFHIEAGAFLFDLKAYDDGSVVVIPQLDVEVEVGGAISALNSSAVKIGFLTGTGPALSSFLVDAEAYHPIWKTPSAL